MVTKGVRGMRHLNHFPEMENQTSHYSTTPLYFRQRVVADRHLFSVQQEVQTFVNMHGVK